jgi:hypothetical protein
MLSPWGFESSRKGISWNAHPDFEKSDDESNEIVAKLQETLRKRILTEDILLHYLSLDSPSGDSPSGSWHCHLAYAKQILSEL